MFYHITIRFLLLVEFESWLAEVAFFPPSTLTLAFQTLPGSQVGSGVQTKIYQWRISESCTKTTLVYYIDTNVQNLNV